MKKKYIVPEVRVKHLELESFICNVSIKENKLIVDVDEYDITDEEILEM